MTSEEHRHVQELEALAKRYRGRIVALKLALRRAQETIHIWHGDVGWTVYQASPEMQQIAKALGDDK